MEITKTKEKSLLQRIYNMQPRNVFLIDALGALMTSSILGLVLPLINDIFLLDKQIFYLLAAYVVVLFIYSLSVYLIKPSNWAPFLRLIAIANAAYCLFTFAIIFFISPTISTLGMAYFIGEAGLILGIAYTEWTFANQNKDKQFNFITQNI